MRAGGEHDQPINPEPHTAGGGHAMFHCVEKVVIGGLSLFVPGGAESGLLVEPAALVVGIVKLGEGIRDFMTGNEKLESLHEARASGMNSRKRTDVDRMAVNESRLNERWLHKGVEQDVRKPAGGGVILEFKAVVFAGFLQGRGYRLMFRDRLLRDGSRGC